jgi:hypothetical protein
MILVEGPDTRAVIMRARDHTPGTVNLILESAITLLLGCELARDDKVHVLKQSKQGAESYTLQLSDGRQFHFRPGSGGHGARTIRVYDSYRNGELVAELPDREAVWAFFDGLAV